MHINLNIAYNPSIFMRTKISTYCIYSKSCDKSHKLAIKSTLISFKSSREQWMVRAVDRGAIEGATDNSSDGSGSSSRSDGWCERWIRDQ